MLPDDAKAKVDSPIVAVVGLGYVGLPLVVEFGKHCRTIGFDIWWTRSTSAAGAAIRRASFPRARCDWRTMPSTPATRRALREADFIIVAVPTPVDDAHIPDFGPLVGASEIVGPHLKRGAIVVYESTVYPGATEEVCIPVLEQHSGLKWKQDFFVGYCPERINPGDKEHTLTKIVKVVVGRHARRRSSKVAAALRADRRARRAPRSSIKVAEAARSSRTRSAT